MNLYIYRVELNIYENTFPEIFSVCAFPLFYYFIYILGLLKSYMMLIDFILCACTALGGQLYCFPFRSVKAVNNWKRSVIERILLN